MRGFGAMRGLLPALLCVAALVAVACVVAVPAEAEPSAVGEFVAVHRHFPRPTRVFPGSTVPADSALGFRGRRVEPVPADGKRLQWNFHPFNPFQTFGVRPEGHVHKKCGMAAKLGSWWSNLFAQGREHHRDHHHHHHQNDEEHHREHDHEHRFGRNMEHQHQHDEEHHLEHDHEHRFGRNMEHQYQHDEEHHRKHDHEHRFGRNMEHQHRHRASFGWGLLVKIGRWFSGIPSFLSDVPAIIKTWSARAGGRKPPSVESVTEPLDMHSLQKTSSPSLSCNLQEKLLQVFAAASEEVDGTTGSTDNNDSQSDVIKTKLKKFMGDSMQLRIAKSICDSASMTSCEQEFCDVFLSHRKSGVLMAFRVLGLNPVRAAIKSARLSFSSSLSRSVLSKNEMDMIMNLRKSRRLAHIVFQRVLAANPTEGSVADLQHKLKSLFSKFSGGVLNPCKACLRQEIFRLKKLTKKAMIEVCENPVDSYLEQSCNFAKENRFVFKTLFAYKFRLWEKAAFVCRARKACDSFPTPSASTYEQASNTLEEEEMHNLRFAHFDVNTFRNPRGAEAAPAVMASAMHGKVQNCRQRALHRAAMLRGHSLDALASELLKVEESLSLQRENGPIIVVEFVAHSQMENNQETDSFPLSLGAFSPQKWELLHSAINFEHGFAGSAEFDPLREIMKRPLFDSSPVHPDAVIEDAFVKPQDVPAVTSIATEVPLDMSSSNESSTEHPDM